MNFKTTKVFDVYWNFACKRQDIFFKRLNKESYPWTDDPILQKYKFTNAYRVTDRTSQYLIKNVIYERSDFTPEDTIFRILLFKIFNKIETWESLQDAIGEIRYSDFNIEKYEHVFDSLIKQKNRLYSAAYIMPSGKSTFGYDKKHKNNLCLLQQIMSDRFSEKLAKAKSLKEIYNMLLSYPTIGSFLAFQYAIDLNYSELCDFSEMSFVVAGPGAKSGIEKCFLTDKYEYEKIINFMAENQENEFKKRGLNFKTLFGRPLQLIDCQNLFCETDKYSRVSCPEISSNQNRTRIKQNYTFKNKEVELFLPPKWGLTQR